MQVIQCDDHTCKHNTDGYCRCQSLVINVGRGYQYDVVNICESYEVKEDAGED